MCSLQAAAHASHAFTHARATCGSKSEFCAAKSITAVHSANIWFTFFAHCAMLWSPADSKRTLCQAVFARAHARQSRSVHRSKTCIFSSRAVTRMIVRVVMAAVRMVAVCNGGSGGGGQRSSKGRLDKMTTIHSFTP